MKHPRLPAGPVSPAATPQGTHMLVVIDHRQARVYRTELQGSVPQRITPYDPGDIGRHLHDVQNDSHGQRRPERRSFYEAVARTLRRAEAVLLFGSGTGSGSAMGQLLIELKHHHPNVARHIVGSITLDHQHLTEAQLLARARDFYAAESAKRDSRNLDSGSAGRDQPGHEEAQPGAAPLWATLP